MPVTPSYPGVYLEEVKSSVRAIAGVSTSVTAFVGSASRGPTNKPTKIFSFSDFENQFGGLDLTSTMSYAVYHYFLNGGAEALIVRVAGGTKSSAKIGSAVIEAAGQGSYGDQIKIRIDDKIGDPTQKNKKFNLFVHDSTTGVTEPYRNVSVDKTDSRFVVELVNERSQLINFHETKNDFGGRVPPPSGNVSDGANPFSPAANTFTPLKGGKDSAPVYSDKELEDGIESLSRSFFNLLCIPPMTRDGSTSNSVYNVAVNKCVEKRAFLLADCGSGVITPKNAKDEFAADFATLDGQKKEYGAYYFPRFKAPDPLKENRLDTFVPCGAVAGMIARTDATRGIWKSPGGIDAGLTGAAKLEVELSDPEQGQLNPEGINCIRNFPDYGNVVWGVRTMAGSDAIASEWKYIAVRRTALFIEESLYRGTQWVVMEPNKKSTWDSIELNVKNFLQRMFRQGAFQGTTPEEAYFVKCNEETTTQADIDLGIVNILVGFAPVKPAEFVIIKIQQIVDTGE